MPAWSVSVTPLLLMWNLPDVTRDFRDRHDAGHRLAAHPHLAHLLEQAAPWTIAAVMPGGAAGAAVVAQHWSLPIIPVTRVASQQDPESVDFTCDGDPGTHVLLIDDGVETGTAARAASQALRAAGAHHIVLAVPVCSHQAEADLAGVVDEVIAVVRPLARRALTWHYDDLGPVDDAVARALLAGGGSADR